MTELLLFEISSSFSLVTFHGRLTLSITASGGQERHDLALVQCKGSAGRRKNGRCHALLVALERDDVSPVTHTVTGSEKTKLEELNGS